MDSTQMNRVQKEFKTLFYNKTNSNQMINAITAFKKIFKLALSLKKKNNSSKDINDKQQKIC